MNDLITLQQLPIIIERLESVKTAVLDKVKYAESCICTEDTVKEVKKYRAELNKQFNELDKQRKAIKEQIMGPYKAFEEKYNECIGDVFKAADKKLAGKINELEDELKNNKRQVIQAYFEELKATFALDWLDWFDVPVNVTLSVSNKKLMEQIKEWVSRIADDVSAIYMQSEDVQPELMLEYRKRLNLSEAIKAVTERRAALEAQKAQEAEAKARASEEAAHVAEVEAEAAKQEALAAPEVRTQVKTYKVSFTVYGTLEQLKAVKAFLSKGGYKYEC